MKILAHILYWSLMFAIWFLTPVGDAVIKHGRAGALAWFAFCIVVGLLIALTMKSFGKNR